jgi:hypothetical protein
MGSLNKKPKIYRAPGLKWLVLAQAIFWECGVEFTALVHQFFRSALFELTATSNLDRVWMLGRMCNGFFQPTEDRE